MKNYFMRLEKYIAVRPTAAMTEVIIQVMVEVISILGIATKEIKERRTSMPFLVIYLPKLTFHAEKFVKRLFGMNRLGDAVQQLENVKAEEALMAGAETLAIAHRIDENVEGITEALQGVRVMVAGMNDKLEIANADIQGVGHEVHSIYAGNLFISSLVSKCVLSLTRLGVTETKDEMQVVLKYVSDRDRS
jgi:hypothetical protein